MKTLTLNLLAVLFGFFLTASLSAEQISPAEFEALLEKAQAGNAEAQARVGVYYCLGEGIEKNLSKGGEWLEKSAAQNNALGERNLSFFYADGQAVPRDLKKAVELMRRAAEHGDAQSQFNVGRWYFTGEHDYPKDYAAAADWLKKSAAQNFADAQLMLGAFYFDGEYVEKNEEQGFALTLAAACQQNAKACVIMARMYCEGVYVGQDFPLAALWLNIAKIRGADNQKLFAALAKQLTPAQLAAAEQRAKLAVETGNLFPETLSVTFADAQRPAVTVPFENIDGFIFIKLKINSSPELNFILDTGASNTAIHSATAEKLQLTGNEYFSVRGIGETVGVAAVTKPLTVTLSGATVSGMRLQTMPLLLDEFIGRPVDGILGSNFLKNFLVSIDYENRTLTLTTPSMWQPDADTVTLPMTFSGLPLIATKLRHNQTTAASEHFMLDTGANSAMDCTMEFQKLNPAVKPRHTIADFGFGIGGEAVNRSGICDAIMLGGFVIEHPPVGFLSASQGIHSGDSPGLIGNGVLSRFTLTLDYPNQKVYLKKNASFGKPFDHRETGMVPRWKRPYYQLPYLDRVKDYTPAAKAGLLADDVILAIDGHATKDTEREKLGDILYADGQHQLLILRQGEVLQGSVSAVNPYDETPADDEKTWQEFKPADAQELPKWKKLLLVEDDETNKAISKEEIFYQYWLAANFSHAQFQRLIAIMYAKGEGVEKDLKKSQEWYRRAAAQGDEVAKEQLAKQAEVK